MIILKYYFWIKKKVNKMINQIIQMIIPKDYFWIKKKVNKMINQILGRI